jgi:hypothetical protein
MADDGHGLGWDVGGMGGDTPRPDPSVTQFQSGGNQGGVPPKIEKPNPGDFGPPTLEGQAPGIIQRQQESVKRTQPMRTVAAKDQAYRGKLASAAAIANDPLAKLHGVPDANIEAAKQFINADKIGSDTRAAIDHRDSVLADPFNKLHYGEDEVDRAIADSAHQAQNIEAIKDSPASGVEKMTTQPVGKERFPNFGQ